MPSIRVRTGVELFHEEFGAPEAPPLLLIMGLGAQLTTWPEEFCRTLAGRGFRVIRYDNRDVENGRRTHAALPEGAELVLIEGMGHDLPPFAFERMAGAIAANAARAKVTA